MDISGNTAFSDIYFSRNFPYRGNRESSSRRSSGGNDSNAGRFL